MSEATLIATTPEFRHVRVEGRARTQVIYVRMDEPGGITVAFKEDAPSQYRVGLAFCSPKDNFNKAKGREIATRRLAGAPLQFESALFLHDLMEILARPYLKPDISMRYHGDGYNLTFSIGQGALMVSSPTLNANKPFQGASWLGDIRGETTDFADEWCLRNR